MVWNPSNLFLRCLGEAFCGEKHYQTWRRRETKDREFNWISNFFAFIAALVRSNPHRVRVLCVRWMNWNGRADSRADTPTAVSDTHIRCVWRIKLKMCSRTQTKNERTENTRYTQVTRLSCTKKLEFVFVRSRAHLYMGISWWQRPTVTLSHTDEFIQLERSTQTTATNIRMHRVHHTVLAAATANYSHTDTQGSSVHTFSLSLSPLSLPRPLFLPRFATQHALLVVRCVYVRTFSLFII